MIKIPNQIKIGPYTYPVVWKEKVVGDDGDELWGQCNHIDHAIYMSTPTPPQRREIAFLHECLHALDELGAIDLKERQVQVLAPLLIQFLRDNGFLVETTEEGHHDH